MKLISNLPVSSFTWKSISVDCSWSDLATEKMKKITCNRIRVLCKRVVTKTQNQSESETRKMSDFI